MPKLVKTATLGPYTMADSSIPHSSNSGTISPYHPFETLQAFKQAEHFVLNNCSDPMIDGQMRIIHEAANGNDPKMFKNAREMHKILAESVDDEFSTKSKVIVFLSLV